MLDVTITVFNPTPIAIQSLKTLNENRAGVERIIIVDNGSTDTTNIPALVPLCDYFITLKKQVSLAQSWNIGIESCNNTIVVVSNDDILFTKDWALPLITAFEDSPVLGILQPYNTLSIIPEGFPNNYKLQDTIGEIPKDNFVGCCFAVNKKIFADLKNFDKKTFPKDWATYSYFYNNLYPFGCEDQDFYRRVRGAGYATLTHFGSYIHHFTGQTIPRVNKYTTVQRTSDLMYKERWRNGVI